MAIGVGDRLPEGTFTHITENGPAPVTTNDIFSGKKVILFGVPGAFTPSCHKTHLPGYVAQFDAIKAKGVDTIACLAVNDAFVLDAWAKATGAAGKVQMLADGNADYTKKLGLDLDLSGFGLGTRSKRFSAIVEDGKVKELNIEEAAGKVTSSGADATICQL
jgi:glutaredoxin/glutathione-dependent peroxiredoxin